MFSVLFIAPVTINKNEMKTRLSTEAETSTSILGKDYHMYGRNNVTGDQFAKDLLLIATKNSSSKTKLIIETKNESFEVIDYLSVEDMTSLFPGTLNSTKLASCIHMKNDKDDIVKHKKMKITSYRDIEVTNLPEITDATLVICGIKTFNQLPITVDSTFFTSRTEKWNPTDSYESSSQHAPLATYDTHITTWHRDTMFTDKVHTISPGSMKVWVFEKKSGDLNIHVPWSLSDQMKHIIDNHSDFDYFIQEPRFLVKHRGSYAHFVLTYIKKDSVYGLWSVLVGLEIATPKTILSCMKCEGPLVQGSTGYLTEVPETTYLRACTTGKSLTMQAFKDSKKKSIDFSEGRKSNAKGRARNKERRAIGYENLKKRKSTASHSPPLSCPTTSHDTTQMSLCEYVA